MELRWRAVYDDKTVLEQFVNGKENKYEDIDRSRLVRFDVLNPSNKAIASVYLHEGERLIWRRRTLVRMDGKRTVIYLAGWQKTVYTNSGPRNITSIMYIYEDGSIALDGTRNNLELLSHEL